MAVAADVAGATAVGATTIALAGATTVAWTDEAVESE